MIGALCGPWGGVQVEHSRAREAFVSAMIINRIIQLMLVQLAAMQLVQHPRTLVWGTLGNTIAGAVGCFGGGQLLSALIPMMAGTGNNIG
jgi:hypothetical protein